MKTNNTNLLSAILITGAVAGLMLNSNIVLSSATLQSNDAGTIATTTTTTGNMTSNATTGAMPGNATTAGNMTSNDQVIMHIDAAITAIKSGDNDKGKQQLLESEESLEGVQSAVDAEKRVEAAIKALKDGDSNGSISQAEEAKKLLTS
jgi:hypothetical protein